MALESSYYRVLSIAGSDSGGGAGIQADIKTISALGGYALSAISAVTAQNTKQVYEITELSPRAIAKQIEVVLSDIGVDAIKIGMLHSPAAVKAVKQSLDKYLFLDKEEGSPIKKEEGSPIKKEEGSPIKGDFRGIVLDPVMVATSGDLLIQKETIQCLIKELFSSVDLITPNIQEAEAILDLEIKTQREAEESAYALLEMGARAVFLKGAHLDGEEITDTLLAKTKNGGFALKKHRHERIQTKNTHGSGCTLSSAITSYLAFGFDLFTATHLGYRYTLEAIDSAKNIVLGEGSAPLEHFFSPKKILRKF